MIFLLLEFYYEIFCLFIIWAQSTASKAHIRNYPIQLLLLKLLHLIFYLEVLIKYIFSF